MGEMERITEEYYANNAHKLRRMVNTILKKFGGLSDKDMDDFYSLANEVFLIAMREYNGTGNFHGFLHSRLTNKIYSMMTERNRKKRTCIETVKHADGTVEHIYYQPVSLDIPIVNDDYTITHIDTIAAKDDIWDEVSEEMKFSSGSRIREYLDKLSKKQRKIVLLLMDGYKPGEIKDILHINNSQYADCMCGIRSNENIDVLF